MIKLLYRWPKGRGDSGEGVSLTLHAQYSDTFVYVKHYFTAHLFWIGLEDGLKIIFAC